MGIIVGQNNRPLSNFIETAVATARNNIIYFNSAALPATSNYWFDCEVFAQNNCAAPIITNDGTHLDTDPTLVDPMNGDLHLTASSICIDAGTTNEAPDTDIEDTARPLDGDDNGVAAFDIGAYEYLNAMADSDDDGLKDTNEVAIGTNPAKADSDDDLMKDGGEVIAGTDPLDALSFFSITQISNVNSGLILRWPSVTGRVYRIDTTTNLAESFSSLATNIAATPPENIYTDTVVGAELKHYRCSVRK